MQVNYLTLHVNYYLNKIYIIEVLFGLWNS